MPDRQAMEDLKKSMTPERLAELIADTYGTSLNSDNPEEVALRLIEEFGFETVLDTFFDPDPYVRHEVIGGRMREMSDSSLDVARWRKSNGDDYSAYVEATVYSGRFYNSSWSDATKIGVVLDDGSYMDLEWACDSLDWREAVDDLPVGEYTVVGSAPIVNEVIERLRSRGSKVWDEKSAAEWDDEEESDDSED
jgi:hypothetical protein